MMDYESMDPYDAADFQLWEQELYAESTSVGAWLLILEMRDGS